MKIYRIQSYHKFSGTVIDWASSKAAAKKILAQHRRSRAEAGEHRFSDLDSITPLDIEMTRSGIVSFLRFHTPSTDNG